jgi:hypothetical protein
MLRRILNIASVVACVALMGVWVLSYRWYDSLNSDFTVHSLRTAAGGLHLELDLSPMSGRMFDPSEWWLYSYL